MQTKKLNLLFASLLAGFCVYAADYHIDAASGDDTASGLSPEQAWQSLEKANSVMLQPGDSLLFKAGEQWTGQLKPQGQGRKSAPIRIGRYGEGSLPRIDGAGAHRDTVLLKNISFIELTDLEVTNLGPETAPWRTGVRVLAERQGPIEHIVLRGLYVHDVNGDLRKAHEGCGIYFESRGGQGACFKGLLIEKCRVERTDRNGICQRTDDATARSTHVVIRENVLEDIGGDGIKLWGTNGGLIEKNIVRKARARCEDAAAGIWPFASDDTVVQFNEVSGTVGTFDGQAYDSDYYCRRSIFQYNYSYRNEGGFMLVCSPGKGYNEDTIIRYNISIHDGINTARVFHFGGKSTGTKIYNNTIVVGPHQDLPMLLFKEWNGGTAQDTTFINNLFVVEEGGRVTYEFGPSRDNKFKGNLFVGRHEGLPKEASEIYPISEFEGRAEPAPLSEALNELRPSAMDFPKGALVEDNGGRDFFGKSVFRHRNPSIGAIQ